MIKNVSIRTRSPEMIDFFYPNYTRLKEFSPFVDGGVIFEGDSKYLQRFRDANIPYIYVKGTPEYDLTIATNLIDFVYSKWDKKPPKKVVEYVECLDYEKSKLDIQEIDDMCKQIWVTGKCSIEESTEERMSGLQKMLARASSYELMKEFLTLSDRLDSEKVFYSIQSFLKSTNSISTIKNAYRKKQVEDFVSARGKNIESALMQYLYSPANSDEIKLLKLLDALTVIKYDR